MSSHGGKLITGWSAQTYDWAKFWNFGWRITKRVEGEIPDIPNLKILDIGCGTGTLLKRISLRKNKVSLYGLEPSEDMIEIAREKLQGTTTELVVASANSLPFADNTFDYVISSIVFHHLPQDTKEKALQEISRVLKPRGTFILADIGKVDRWWKHILSFTQRNHAFSQDNLSGNLEKLLFSSPFLNTELIDTIYLPWSPIDIYRGTK